MTFAFQTLAVEWSRILVGGTLTLFIVVCVLLVLTILIQKPQGGGLSGAFGAGASGSGQTAFGTKTGDALTWMTIAMFVIYLGAAIGMNYTMRPPAAAPVAPAAGAPAPGTAPVGGTGEGVATPPVVPESGTTPPATTTTTVKPVDLTVPPATNPSDKPADPAAKPADPKPADPAAAPVAPAPVVPPATTPPATTPPATPPATPR